MAGVVGGGARALRRAALARLAAAPFAALPGQQAHLLVFVPVLLGCGIGAWFALEADPGAAVLACVAALAALGAAVGARGPPLARAPAFALACAAAGFVAADLRARAVAAPVLAERYHGAVEGRIVLVDRNNADRLRLTLDRVVLDGIAPAATPARVRIVLQTDQPHLRPAPGLVVMTTAHLAPPEGRVEPGGFDFRRWAWFRGLGAIGYTRMPVLARAPPAPGEARVNRLRDRIADAIRAAIPGDAGGFAAAVATGDRSGITAAATEHLRDSNLSHILSISGMHMALLTGFLFVAVRSAIALWPAAALRLPGKKIAAGVALAGATFYLALSGGSVPTLRAWVMVAVMLVAVLCDRQALSLRSVALAGAAILLVQPEALVDPGFQMSFAATVALIAGFALLRARLGAEGLGAGTLGAAGAGTLGAAGAWVATLVAASLLAGFASAPFAAAHFNRFSDYGLLANLLAGPVMGTLVMPALAVAAVLAPFGLAAPALWAMGVGCETVLAISAFVAGLDGAVTPVVRPPPAVLPLIALGGAFLAGWRGGARWVGLAPVAVAGALWAGAPRPLLLVAPDGAVAGLLGTEGRALSAARGGAFAARAWLEDDGDTADQRTAAARPGFEGQAGARRFRLGAHAGAIVTGRGAAARAEPLCAEVALLIVAEAVPAPPAGGCLLLDAGALRERGAVAVDLGRDGALRIVGAGGERRRWSRPPGRGG